MEDRGGGGRRNWKAKGEIGPSLATTGPRGTNGEWGVGEEGMVMNGGPSLSPPSLCRQSDGQLQLEHAPMHCRWSGQCFEWPENIPPSSICIERRKQCAVSNLEPLRGLYRVIQ